MAGSSSFASLKIILGLDAAGVKTGVAQANSAMTSLNKTTAGVGKSMSTLKGRVSGLTKVVGLVGLAGGLATVVGFMKGSIDAATEFGTTVERLAQLTGLAVGDVSQLSDAMDYFGLSSAQQIKSVGMLEKNLGNLTKTTATADKFQKEYGLSLLDSNGKAKDAQTIIEDTADFWNNKGIPQQTKVVALNKLYGRGWQDLIPLLSQGRQGIIDATEAGIRLTPAQIAANTKLRKSQRAWNDSIGDLKIVVGNIFIPELSKMADAASSFVNNHQADIARWFRQALEFGKDFAGYLTSSVIPTVKGLASTAVSFWNSIPAPLKDLLIKGFAADRTVKFLFGFSIADVAKDVVGGAIKGLAGHFLDRGSSPLNPMFVSGGVGGGALPGGGLGGLTSGKGVLGMIGIAGAVTIAGVSIAALAEQFGTFMSTNAAAQKDLQGKADAAALQNSTDALTHLGQMTTSLNNIQGLDRMLLDTMGSKETETALINLGHDVSSDLTLTKSGIESAIKTLQAAQAAAISHGWTASAASIGNDIAILTARIPSASAIGAAVGNNVPGWSTTSDSWRSDPTIATGGYGGRKGSPLVHGLHHQNRGSTRGNVYHDQGGGRGGGRAAGGWVEPGMSYTVGERGPEELQMGSQSGRVSPHVGGGDFHVHFHGPVYGGKAALRQLAKDIEDAVRLSRRDRRLVGDPA